jgi:FAD:protein FMN transferase
MTRHDFRHQAMGTGVTVSLWTDRDDASLRPSADAAFQVFDDLDRQFSLFKEDSEISRLNRSAGSAFDVTPRFMAAASYAFAMKQMSHGAFEPSEPDAKVELDRAAGWIRLPNGATLDLNAVVKGMAIDLAMEKLPADMPAMIEAGGDILVRGEPPTGQAWQIGIRDPKIPEKLATVTPILSGAVCTSGEYFRGAHLRGERSLRSRTASMTVAAPTAQEADALSTAAYFMPIEEAVAFVERFPGASCLAIDEDGIVSMSPRMRKNYEA